MKVRAIRDGYYDHHYKHVGVEFEIKDEKRSFSKRWMVPVDEDEAPKKSVKVKKEVEAKIDEDVI